MKTFRLIAQPLLLAIVLALVARGAVRLYSIPSLSMEPTLRVGDHILVTPYHRALPRRGDIVVFRSQANRGELFVKRIVAVAGDLVESRAGRLVICGHAVAEPYVLAQATTSAIPSQIVPAESYFALGDNRANSFDSRQWGILPRSMIVGRARLILWSSGRGTMTPRVSAAPISSGTSPSAALRFDRLFRPID